MKKLFITLFLFISTFAFSQNAWKVGEVGDFVFTALYTDEVVVTRKTDVNFNLVLEYQQIDFFKQGLNEWLRIDSIYDEQLMAYQKFLRTIHKQNVSVTFIFTAEKNDRKMLMDVSGIIPYKFETFEFYKEDIQKMLTLIDECQKVSKEKRKSVRKLD